MTTILYKVNADMIIDCDIVESESVNTNINALDELPDINQLRAELTILGGSDSPPPKFVMPLLTIDLQPLDIHQTPPLLTVPV